MLRNHGHLGPCCIQKQLTCENVHNCNEFKQKQNSFNKTVQNTREKYEDRQRLTSGERKQCTPPTNHFPVREKGLFFTNLRLVPLLKRWGNNQLTFWTFIIKSNQPNHTVNQGERWTIVSTFRNSLTKADLKINLTIKENNYGYLASC